MFIILFYYFLVNLGARGQELYLNLYNDIYFPSQNQFFQGEISTSIPTQLPHDQYRPPGINI